MESLLRGDKSSSIPSLAGKINLIYIDPPFFTGSDFSVKTTIGNKEVEKEPSIIEQRAYIDTWSQGIASYLKYMYERLVLMRELLADNGSIYVHLDERLGHYIKIILDEIFGYDNFRNEIVWRYKSGGSSEKGHYSRKHDVIFFYTKSDKYTFRTLKEKSYSREFKPYHFEGVQEFTDEIGSYTVVNMKDVWNIDMVGRTSKERLDYATQKPEQLLKRIIVNSSNEGDLIADFFCGSGTTAAVAEKLGRRWIMCDLGKFAIHTTRKRLMNIHKSKLLKDNLNEIYEEMPEIKEEFIEYGNPSRPFEILNIGNYSIGDWQEKEEGFVKFILQLYQTKPLTGFNYIHGEKEKRAVHVGSLSAPVTIDEIKTVVEECNNNNFKSLDVLGLEWGYGVNELAKALAQKSKVDLRLIQIPSYNELSAALVGLDLNLFKIPDEIVEEKISENIKFLELSYLELETKIKGKNVELEIADFQLPPTPELAEIADKIKDPIDLIDYWAVDWDYQGDTFHNQWQSYRTKKEPKVDKKATYTYEKAGKYQIMVKVIDVFGGDVSKIINVKIK
ncbi:MAG: site-specific DNA-methyltransferase [Bacteroidales bacterium]|nr:site-specific DNA-methyltransferase [Bacteroidales bacterium]